MVKGLYLFSWKLLNKKGLDMKELCASPITSAWTLSTGRECSQKWGPGNSELEAGTQTQVGNLSQGQPEINKEFGCFRDSWSDVFALRSDTVSPVSLSEVHTFFAVPFGSTKLSRT